MLSSSSMFKDCVPILYYDELTPQARSCIMLIHMLQIPVDMKYIDLFNGAHLKDEYAAINPLRTVPTLVHGDLTLYDGHTILMYLCENFGGVKCKQLFPQNVAMRYDIVSKLFFESNILYRRHSEFLTELLRKTAAFADIEFYEKKILGSYNILESLLSKTNYLCADWMTLADISCVTTTNALHLMFPIVETRWPKVFKWLRNMCCRPEYKFNVSGIEKQRELMKTVGHFDVNEKSIPKLQNQLIYSDYDLAAPIILAAVEHQMPNLTKKTLTESAKPNSESKLSYPSSYKQKVNELSNQKLTEKVKKKSKSSLKVKKMQSKSKEKFITVSEIKKKMFGEVEKLIKKQNYQNAEEVQRSSVKQKSEQSESITNKIENQVATEKQTEKLFGKRSKDHDVLDKFAEQFKNEKQLNSSQKLDKNAIPQIYRKFGHNVIKKSAREYFKKREEDLDQYSKYTSSERLFQKKMKLKNLKKIHAGNRTNKTKNVNATTHDVKSNLSKNISKISKISDNTSKFSDKTSIVSSLNTKTDVTLSKQKSVTAQAFVEKTKPLAPAAPSKPKVVKSKTEIANKETTAITPKSETKVSEAAAFSLAKLTEVTTDKKDVNKSEKIEKTSVNEDNKSEKLAKTSVNEVNKSEKLEKTTKSKESEKISENEVNKSKESKKTTVSFDNVEANKMVEASAANAHYVKPVTKDDLEKSKIRIFLSSIKKDVSEKFLKSMLINNSKSEKGVVARPTVINEIIDNIDKRKSIPSPASNSNATPNSSAVKSALTQNVQSSLPKTDIILTKDTILELKQEEEQLEKLINEQTLIKIKNKWLSETIDELKETALHEFQKTATKTKTNATVEPDKQNESETSSDEEDLFRVTPNDTSSSTEKLSKEYVNKSMKTEKTIDVQETENISEKMLPSTSKKCKSILETDAEQQIYSTYCLPDITPNYPKDYQIKSGLQNLGLMGKNIDRRTKETENNYGIFIVDENSDIELQANGNVYSLKLSGGNTKNAMASRNLQTLLSKPRPLQRTSVIKPKRSKKSSNSTDDDGEAHGNTSKKTVNKTAHKNRNTANKQVQFQAKKTKLKYK